MKRHLTIEFIKSPEPSEHNLVDLANDLNERVQAEGVDCKVGLSRYPDDQLAELGVSCTPSTVIDGMLWLDGEVPSEQDVELILARFCGRFDDSMSEDADTRPLPTTLTQAADIVLDMLDEDACARLLRLPEGEAIRILTGQQFGEILDSFSLVKNRMLLASTRASTPHEAIWTILNAARLAAQVRETPEDPDLNRSWLRLRILDCMYRRRIITWRTLADTSELQTILKEINTAEEAWWLANIGVELAAAGDSGLASLAIKHAMRLGQATTFRIEAVMYKLQEKMLAEIIDYLKGLSPPGVEYIDLR